MSKRAEEKAIAYQLATRGPNVMGGASILSEDEYRLMNINYDFKAGYEQAESDIIERAMSIIGKIYEGFGYTFKEMDREWVRKELEKDYE